MGKVYSYPMKRVAVVCFQSLGEGCSKEEICAAILEKRMRRLKTGKRQIEIASLKMYMINQKPGIFMLLTLCLSMNSMEAYYFINHTRKKELKSYQIKQLIEILEQECLI